ALRRLDDDPLRSEDAARDRAAADDARLAPLCERGRPLTSRWQIPQDHVVDSEEHAVGDYDLVIKDGIVIDGTRSQRYRADVGIRSGRIAALGRLKTKDARRTLDAS